jgi:hypothetical protein
LIYGNRGDPIRKKLSNKVTQWKLLHREKYLGKLVKLGLQPAANLPKADIQKLVPKSSPKRTPGKKRVPSIPEEVSFSSPEEEPVRPPFEVDPKLRKRGFSTSSEDVRDQILANHWPAKQDHSTSTMRCKLP